MEADQKLNIRGLVLPYAAISPLKKYGIYAQTAVSLEHQSVARRYVVRGVESGGAVEETGRYVTFAGENGEALSWLQPVDSLTVNGVHALVVAPLLTRVEMFRKGHTYELRITRHRPGPGEKGRRPELLAENIFRGREGYLGLELWGRDKEIAGAVLPQFFTFGRGDSDSGMLPGRRARGYSRGELRRLWPLALSYCLGCCCSGRAGGLRTSSVCGCATSGIVSGKYDFERRTHLREGYSHKPEGGAWGRRAQAGALAPFELLAQASASALLRRSALQCRRTAAQWLGKYSTRM